jgi:hypothetical protein
VGVPNAVGGDPELLEFGLCPSFLPLLLPSVMPLHGANGIRKLTEWAWQLLWVLRRWYPQREIVAVADRAYASLSLLFHCRTLSKPVTFISRLRLDAAHYEPAPPRRPGQRGRPRLKGECLPNLSMVADDLEHCLEAHHARQLVWEPNSAKNSATRDRSRGWHNGPAYHVRDALVCQER